jgi:hypothetical protein
MYAILTLNLIVNIVTLISSLLLITGSIRVSHEVSLSRSCHHATPDHDIGLFPFIHSRKFLLFTAQLKVPTAMAGVRGIVLNIQLFRSN